MWYQTTHGHCYKYIVHRMCSCIPYKGYMHLYKPWRPKGFFNWESSQVSQLALSASFEYQCYESTATLNIFTLTLRGST